MPNSAPPNWPPDKSLTIDGEKILLAVFALCICGFLVLIFWAILAAAPPSNSAWPNLWVPLVKTTHQATLSTLAALSMGICTAIALNRLQFWGKAMFVNLLSIGIVAPAISVAFGILDLWGRKGILANIAQLLGMEWSLNPFGLHAVVLAHTVLSGALAARFIYTALEQIPTERLKQASALDIHGWQRLLILDLPVIRAQLPGLSPLIFLVCFTSFPIVLILGGGPKVTTFEILIYQATRLNFDLFAASILAITQLAICAILILPTLLFAPRLAGGRASRHFFLPDSLAMKVLASLTIALSVPLILAPVFLPITALTNLNELAEILRRDDVILATQNSLFLAFISAILVTLLAFLLASARAQQKATSWRVIASLPTYAYLAVPGVVLALGGFLLARNFGIALSLAAPVMILLANILLGLPFALTLLSASIDEVTKRYANLEISLSIPYHRRIVQIELPLIAKDLSVIFAITFCFSLGDLGVIALFGTQDFSTLPWLIIRALGAYRTNEAAILTALLITICTMSFVASATLRKYLER